MYHVSAQGVDECTIMYGSSNSRSRSSSSSSSNSSSSSSSSSSCNSSSSNGSSGGSSSSSQIRLEQRCSLSQVSARPCQMGLLARIGTAVYFALRYTSDLLFSVQFMVIQP